MTDALEAQRERLADDAGSWGDLTTGDTQHRPRTGTEVPPMGDSIGIARLFLAYAVGAICIFIANRVMTPILDNAAESAEGTAAMQGNEWLSMALTALPFVYIMVGFFGIIAYTVYRRRGTRL